MRAYRPFVLALVLAVTGAHVASAQSSETPPAEKKKKKRSKKKPTKKSSSSKKKKRTSHRSKRSKKPRPIPGLPQETEAAPVTDPGAVDVPTTATGEATPTDATGVTPEPPVDDTVSITDTPDEPVPDADTTQETAAPKPAASITATTTTTPAPRPARRPTWFVALRGGPSVIDRRGYYEYSSNRQIYATERNVRLDLVVGRYLSRRLSLGLAVGTGPFVKFDAPEPSYDENTRFKVFPAHARLDATLHVGPFVAGLGAGGAYERADGSFGVFDPDTSLVTMHTATFKRFGVMGTAQTGLQVQLGHVGFELLAEASAVKLMRGTYVHGVETPGPSDREMCYEASLLLGFRLQ